MWFALLLLLVAPCVDGDVTIDVQVSLERLPSNPIPKGFTSFSCADTILDILSMATSPGSYTPRPSFTSLMNLLGGGGNIRLGHWWAPNNSSHTSFSSYPQANASNLQRVSAALASFNGTATPMVPPVDTADGALVAATGAAFARHLPPSQFSSLELANEPDLHPSPFSTNFPLYEHTLDVWLSALEAVGLERIVDAPVLAGGAWWPLMGGFLQAFAPRLHAFSQHRYGLSACSHLHPPTQDALMRVNTSWGSPNDTALLAVVAGAGLPFVVGEGNTVSCNGSAGVSDTFGAALYALDASLSALAANASAFRWHGVGDDAQYFFYQPVYYEVGRLREVGYDAAYPRPLFLGLWALAEAAPTGSTLLRTLVNASSSSSSSSSSTGGSGDGDGGDPPLLVAWALRHPSPSTLTTVIILNKETSLPAQASVTPPTTPCAPGSYAMLTRLLSGPGGLGATKGSTFANLSFDGTQNGVPVGTRYTEKVPCGGGGGGGGSGSQYTFSLPPASAALLVFG